MRIILYSFLTFLKKLYFSSSSSYGLNEFHRNAHNGGVAEVRFVSLDEWLREFDLFEKLRQISFFRGFKLTKSFQTWKRVVKRAAFITSSQTLIENSCILGTNTRMRDCFLQVRFFISLTFRRKLNYITY